ncbi:hypothetical protein JAAARDRAFT_54664 [Jaapia argillacea MUCL 33604]|uniref:FYR N-terminal domain-containing protein n=1 Tax=Jaapia argillacea MUCL 33604 TaxID=933084 RepID=A0A067QGY1_9AGAM|nr:hypothetical protein JAAARDRAFT_54664 [Jaapia argillacea MUCL 33604]
MGPPPIPPQPPVATSQVLSQQPQNAANNQDINEKYRRLKRKYFELEEKYKEATTELQASGRRNARMREDRISFLDRIIELESGQSSAPQPPHPQAMFPPQSAFPRSLMSAQAKFLFQSNLRQAIHEIETEDHDIDPLLTSRHVGPQARKRRQLEEEEKRQRELKEREALAQKQAKEEENAKRGSKRSRGKAREQPPPAPPPHHQMPPGPHHIQGPGHPPPPHQPSSASPPVLVSSTGTRLRLKPPAPPLPPPAEPGHHVPGHPQSMAQGSMSHHSHQAPPQHQRHPQPHPHAQHSRSQVHLSHHESDSQSPTSPYMSAHDDPHASGSHMRSHSHSSHHSHSHSHSQTHSHSQPPHPPPHQYPHSPPDPYYQASHQQQSHPNLVLSPPAQHPHSPNSSRSDRPSRPKRLKAHTVTPKQFNIPPVPRDRKGKPLLPLNVGIMTIINLGEICLREHFHTERYIFPVGYEVARRYASTVDPNNDVVYNCTILDGGDGPKFQIIPSDAPSRPFVSGTPTGAWAAVVKQANHIRNRQHSNSVSGPDFFGLGQNTVKHLLQELEGADKLKNYVWQQYMEGG